jgi:hypothetical protein
MKIQKDKNCIPLYLLLIVGIFALTLHLGTAGALAADTDLDGFANEEAGINLPTGTTMIATDNIQLSSLLKCIGTETGVAREKCVNPTTKDLFVIIQRASGSNNIPSPPYGSTNLDPLALVRNSGIGVTIHELKQTSGTQAIGDYFAVKIIENLTLDGTYLGFSTFGTFAAPYTGGVATVWTNKIKAAIDKACTSSITSGTTTWTIANATSFFCKNANSSTSINMKTSPDLTPLYREYTRNIISHEVDHMIHLASAAGTVDHHYTTLTGVLMEQNIVTKQTVDKSGNVLVTLYISTGLTKDDKSQFLLKAQQ